MTFSERSQHVVFPFDCSATSVSLQHGRAWLPARPVAGEAWCWPLDQRVSSHFQVTGWPPRPASPRLSPKAFCRMEAGGSQSPDTASCGGNTTIDLEPFKETITEWWSCCIRYSQTKLKTILGCFFLTYWSCSRKSLPHGSRFIPSQIIVGRLNFTEL